MTGPASPEAARGRNPLLYIMIALVVVLAAVAVWFVVAWLRARDGRAAASEAQLRASTELVRAEHDESIKVSRVREEVTQAAQRGIVTFHSLDYHKADETVDAWAAASTGPLHDEVVGRRANSKQAIEAAKTVAKPEVLSLAVTDLDDRAGTATAIAAVKVDVIAEGQSGQAPKYLRIQASLQRTGDGWRLSGIGQVDFARN
jgi:Mce-associated membrane protein